MTRQIYHFRNLSRGLLCPCKTSAERLRYTRIPSTWCEQKLWDRVIDGAGPELLFALANGHIGIVHDLSERSRETRACWQGLSWLRYACWRAWNNKPAPTEVSRSGLVINDYWEEQWRVLPRPVKHWLRYFGQFYTPGNTIWLRSCWKRGGGRLFVPTCSTKEVGRVYEAIRVSR